MQVCRLQRAMTTTSRCVSVLCAVCGRPRSEEERWRSGAATSSSLEARAARAGCSMVWSFHHEQVAPLRAYKGRGPRSSRGARLPACRRPPCTVSLACELVDAARNEEGDGIAPCRPHHTDADLPFPSPSTRPTSTRRFRTPAGPGQAPRVQAAGQAHLSAIDGRLGTAVLDRERAVHPPVRLPFPPLVSSLHERPL